MKKKICECNSGKNLKRKKAGLVIECPYHGTIDTEKPFAEAEKPKHTPGPQIVRLPNGDGKGYAILQEGGNPVYFPQEMIDFCDDWLGGIHKVVNALLADAAAPELLAELIRIHDTLEPDAEGNRIIPAGFLDRTRAVIAKAEGRACRAS